MPTDGAPPIALASLADGSLTRIIHHGVAVLLVRVGDGVHAVADTCTHEDVSLSLGSLCEHRLRCPLHGSDFDVRSGAVLCEPADKPLRTWRTDVIDGMVHLRD